MLIDQCFREEDDLLLHVLVSVQTWDRRVCTGGCGSVCLYTRHLRVCQHQRQPIDDV